MKKNILSVLCITAAIVFSSGRLFAQSIHLKFSAFTGTSADPGATGMFNVGDVSLGIETQVMGTISGTLPNLSKAAFSTVQFSITGDNAAMQAIRRAQLYRTPNTAPAVFVYTRPGAAAVAPADDYYIVVLYNPIIKSIAESCGGDGPTTYSITLGYTKIAYKARLAKADGTLDLNINLIKGFDVAHNIPYTPAATDYSPY